MKIKLWKRNIDWDILEFKSVRRASFSNKYLKINKELNTISIQEGIFSEIKECTITQELLHSIICDIKKMNITKWKDKYLGNDRSIDGEHWELCLFKNDVKVIEKIGYGSYPKKFKIMKEIYEMLISLGYARRL